MYKDSPFDDYYGHASLVTLKKPLALIGFFGSDAPQLAHLITQKTGLPISDIERNIEQLFGTRYSELKIRRPQALQKSMRSSVQQALRRLPPPLILLHPESLDDIVVRENIGRFSNSIFLKRSPDYILNRLLQSMNSPYRDLGFQDLPSLDSVSKAIESLSIGYQTAHWVLDGGVRAPRDISNEIISRLTHAI